MARIADTMTWALYEAEFRAAINVATGEDLFLEGLLEAATQAADSFIDSDWVDGDGADLPIPVGVRQGVYEWARVVRSGTGSSAPKAGVRSVKVGDNQVTYSSDATQRTELAKQAIEAARPWWWAPKTNKGR